MHKAEIAQVADGCDLNEKSGSWVGCYTDPLRRNPLDGGFFSHFLTNLLIQYLTE
jgi:hypothetical protein